MFAKKSLGQHFLRSEGALAKIVAASELSGVETVLEIGPGQGALTKRLLGVAKEVIAVEKDRRLIPYLTETLQSAISQGRLKLIEGDVLTLSPKELGLKTSSFTLVANIPYYITGEILRTFLSGELQPNRAVLLVQKEVAERIARAKKESILSLSVKAYGNPSYVGTVPRGSFRPVPGVDSAILKIDAISRDFFTDLDELFFFTVIKEGFGQKRKQLVGNLSSFASKEDILGIFDELNIPHDVRAEDISINVWKMLVTRLKLSTKSS